MRKIAYVGDRDDRGCAMGATSERVQSAPIGKGSGWSCGNEDIAMLKFTTFSGRGLDLYSHVFYMKLPFSVIFSLQLMDSQPAVENQRDMLTLLGPDSHSQTEHEG